MNTIRGVYRFYLILAVTFVDVWHWDNENFNDFVDFSDLNEEY